MSILKHLHKVQYIEICVSFSAYGRNAYSTAKIDIADIDKPDYVKACIDQSIESFMVKNNPLKARH